MEVLHKRLENLTSSNGHIVKAGAAAGQRRNAFKLVENYYEMDTESGAIFKFDISDLEKVQFVPDCNYNPPTWYLMQNGYIACHLPKGKILYLHQHLTGHWGHGKGQESVDHINRDKLDNRISNLRIVSQSEQNRNMDKRKRKYNAQPLPAEIKEPLPKFVTYNSEYTGSNKDIFRNFFRIEKHPNLKKTWTTTKSMKVDIKTKLQEAIDQLKILDKGGEVISHEKRQNQLPPNCGINEDIPKYCRYIPANGKRSESFIIERHPKLDKRHFQTTASKTVSLLDKWLELKKKLNELEN